jgi:hypothetical protein
MIKIIEQKKKISGESLFQKGKSKAQILKFMKISIEVKSEPAQTIITLRKNRHRQGRLRNKISLDERKCFCTCLPSGNQVDGLPLASRKDAASASWFFFRSSLRS